MGVIKFFEKFWGSLFISLGIALLVITLLASGLNENLDNVDPILEEVVDDFMLINAEEMVEMALEEELGDVDLDEMVQACDDGLIDGEDCEQVYALEEGNLTAFFGDELEEQSDLMVEGMKEPMMDLFSPVQGLYKVRGLMYSIVVVLLCVGGFLMFLGVGRDWLKLASRLGWSVGLNCLGWAVVLLYVNKMDSSILDSVNVEGPEFLLEMVLDMLVALFHPAVEPLIMPLFYFAVLGLAVAVGFLVYRIVLWFKGREK